MMVELRPRHPTLCEYLVWGWSATLWLEELRQVCLQFPRTHALTYAHTMKHIQTAPKEAPKKEEKEKVANSTMTIS